MKANTNAADPASWSYWTNAHVNYCPHGVPYFLTWHRGFLYYFEQRLRAVSGDATLVLPYWNYYTNPQMPSEFTVASSNNPLYVPRVNTNVQQALDWTAFGSSVLQFPRPGSPAFEPILEDGPHNPVHNIIGGVMADMYSPDDPIFWLHHANIDRLWVAWVAAGGGRAMPPTSNSYWSGSFTYASNLSIARNLTYNNRTSLGYYYTNESMPLASAKRLTTEVETSAAVATAVATPPAPAEVALSKPRSISATTFATVGASGIGLGQQSLNVPLPVPAEHQVAMTRVARGLPSATLGRSEIFRSIRLTFDKVEATKEGLAGGYFYNVWLIVPGIGASPWGNGRIKAGTLGAFQIAASHHHTPGTVAFDITSQLRNVTPTDLATMTVYFERVSGDASPPGALIGIGEARVDMSTEQ
jgi:tyrosinase